MGKSCLQDINIPHVLEDFWTFIHLQSRRKECKDLYVLSVGDYCLQVPFVCIVSPVYHVYHSPVYYVYHSPPYISLCKGGFTIYARASIAQLPALRCSRKCIQNDLDERHNISQCVATRIQIILYALLAATQHRQLCYARSCVYCEPALS